ncbi:hypothetical protein B0T22DRAFT_473829 [Podospora appendiculata]|uniref:Secreted protein n=1 Tax=Podospora appendiculata TaxID=314037 RepID=A0AAE1C771_9PEZI|nr:hypothetical protein B0T22DRAFT_473829 [Podospora appendiculata]
MGGGQFRAVVVCHLGFAFALVLRATRARRPAEDGEGVGFGAPVIMGGGLFAPGWRDRPQPGKHLDHLWPGRAQPRRVEKVPGVVVGAQLQRSHWPPHQLRDALVVLERGRQPETQWWEEGGPVGRVVRFVFFFVFVV